MTEILSKIDTIEMFDHHLFFGFPASATYLQQLERLPISLTNLFIQSQPSDYLQKVEYEGMIYLGKSVGHLCEMSSLEALQINIYSLLKKLISPYPYEQQPLLLFALASSFNTN